MDYLEAHENLWRELPVAMLLVSGAVRLILVFPVLSHIYTHASHSHRLGARLPLGGEIVKQEQLEMTLEMQNGSFGYPRQEGCDPLTFYLGSITFKIPLDVAQSSAPVGSSRSRIPNPNSWQQFVQIG